MGSKGKFIEIQKNLASGVTSPQKNYKIKSTEKHSGMGSRFHVVHQVKPRKRTEF